jgi:site-specific DNA recombinase
MQSFGSSSSAVGRRQAAHGAQLRAVIYARYSTEHQREASIEDQAEVCRRYAASQGWTIVERYADPATSGASAALRPGFQKLLRDAESGKFDILICEAVDRLGRKLSDVSAMFDNLSFLGIQVHATSIGAVSQMHIGIMGTMAQMTLSDLREKTWRGQLGRAKAGRIPGGLAYGYEVVPQAAEAKDGGERRILPDEAATVTRIFIEYAAGHSPRHIAYRLNEEGVRGPKGRPWGDTTIRGQVDRGTGLLNNTLYIGRLSWNRCSYVKNPNTGLRVARINPRAHWEEIDLPELRIVDQDLWDAVKARQQAVQFEIGKDSFGQSLNRAHRRKFLLSGLVNCGCCGGGYTIVATDRYGCATRRGKGTCTNTNTITRQNLERRVLSGLKHRMLTPALAAEFTNAFAQEAAARHNESTGDQDRLAKDLADVQRRLEGVLRAVEAGAWSESLQTRLTELEATQKKLKAQVAATKVNDAPISLPVNAADIYASNVADLEISLGDPEICVEAGEALGALIRQITLVPADDEPDRLRIQLHGDFEAILAAAGRERRANEKPRRTPGLGMRRGVSDGLLSVVAGVGFEPTTFRL